MKIAGDLTLLFLPLAPPCSTCDFEIFPDMVRSRTQSIQNFLKEFSFRFCDHSSSHVRHARYLNSYFACNKKIQAQFQNIPTVQNNRLPTIHNIRPYLKKESIASSEKINCTQPSQVENNDSISVLDVFLASVSFSLVVGVSNLLLVFSITVDTTLLPCTR